MDHLVVGIKDSKGSGQSEGARVKTPFRTVYYTLSTMTVNFGTHDRSVLLKSVHFGPNLPKFTLSEFLHSSILIHKTCINNTYWSRSEIIWYR